MEYPTINDKEISEKFNQWWTVSFKGNVPILHPLDLDRFAELIKVSHNKQGIFNSSVLHDFLYEQQEKGNLKKNQTNLINYAVNLYEFSVNNLAKFFK